MMDPKQMHPWLVARLNDLRLEAGRFAQAADDMEWTQVADQLSRVSDDIGLAQDLLDNVVVG